MACNANSVYAALGAIVPHPNYSQNYVVSRSLSVSSSISAPNLNSNSIPKRPPLLFLSTQSSSSSFSGLSLPHLETLIPNRCSNKPFTKAPKFMVMGSGKAEPLRIMISGAPASGKGTQCQLITQKVIIHHLPKGTPVAAGVVYNYDLVHIAAGDLLRAEVAAGSENGRRARENMEKGQLVPDEIVVMMVKERLLQPDSQEKGWLLDGYPRSSSQANALKGFGFEPDLFILLEVSEEILVERVVGRRLDPVTGKIYHLKYSPPETEEIGSRLTQRFDDTEEKVKLRLRTHHQNVEAVLSLYEDITVKINGNVSKEDVFVQIDGVLTKLLEHRKETSESLAE